MSKFCKNCGNQMQDQETVCVKCGAGAVNTGYMAPAGAKANDGLLLFCKVGIIIASILMIVSTLLPYVSVYKETISLIWADDKPADGVIFCIMAVGCIILALKDKPLREVIVSAGCLALCIYEVTNINKIIKQYSSLTSLLGELVTKRAGFYLIIVSTVALLALSVVHLLVKKGIVKKA